GQIGGAGYQIFPSFNAVNVRGVVLSFEKQVVQYEAQIGLPRAMINQGNVGVVGSKLFKQRFNEVKQVINLFELAPTVLVHFPVAGKNVQGLEQFDRLIGANFV